MGLKNLVDQTCWDLLYNALRYRAEITEVEIFLRFLQEFYDQNDLLFFLYVRAVVARTLHISFKRRWAKGEGAGPPKVLWMSYREATLVSKAVFGSNDEQMHRSFLHIISSQIVGQKKSESKDSRRIEIAQFLHLAIVAYHQSQSSDVNVVTETPLPRANGGDVQYDYPQDSPYLDLQDYYNVPEDAELAEGLEMDNDRTAILSSAETTPTSAPVKKKLVPPESGKGRQNKGSDAWVEGEAWGEGGYYDDGVDANQASMSADLSHDQSLSDYLDGTGIENTVWQDPVGDDQYDDAKSHIRGKILRNLLLWDYVIRSPYKFMFGYYVVDDIYATILLDRENEFMAVLMGSLDAVPEETLDGVHEELLQALRAKLGDAIQSHPKAESEDEFDDLVVGILSSDEFVNGMVRSNLRSEKLLSLVIVRLWCKKCIDM